MCGMEKGRMWPTVMHIPGISCGVKTVLIRPPLSPYRTVVPHKMDTVVHNLYLVAYV